MKKNFKWMTLALAACGAFVGCSDQGGSPEFNVEDPFDIVLSKSSYSYKSKDSLLIVKEPVCKEVKDGGLKYLQWKKETSTPDSIFAYRSKSTAYVREDRDDDEDDEVAYVYDGSSFPGGNWVRADENKNSIHHALVFSSGVLKKTFQYDGSCFMKSFYTQLFNKNSSLKGAETALGKFYEMFSDDDEYELDENEIIEDMRVPDCDELSMHDGDVGIKVNMLKASRGKISLNYQNKTCLIKFSLRYANKESDCQDAYDEYKLNRNTDKSFAFEDYDRSIEYSYDCITELVKKVKADRTTLKKSTASDEDLAKEMTSAAVDVILSGLK